MVNIFDSRLVALTRKHGSIHYFTQNDIQVMVDWTCFLPNRHRVTIDNRDEFVWSMDEVLELIADYPKKGNYYRWDGCTRKVAR